MIPFNKALALVLKNCRVLGKQQIKIENASGFFLAENINSRYDIPFFDNSAVDGYGINSKDLTKLPAKLKISFNVCAGDYTKLKICHGEAVKIMTGAKIPSGVSAVVMKEFTEEINGFVKINKKVKEGENIRRCGEEFKKGTKVLKAGTQITPPVLGLIASLGYGKCLVFKKPKVTVIVTGSELIRPGEKLKPGKIYESNSYSISACLKELGINDHKVVVVKDNKMIIKKHISKALKVSDVVITVGGISVGDYDFVKDIVTSLGVKSVFTKIAIKPAKPNYFGVLGSKLIFGLPGNPVSALVSFNKLIKPAILKMMGAKNLANFMTRALLTTDLYKKKGRLEFVRGFFEQRNGNILVTPCKFQGSHMLSGIAGANCLIYFPEKSNFLPKGKKVELEFLSWS